VATGSATVTTTVVGTWSVVGAAGAVGVTIKNMGTGDTTAAERREPFVDSLEDGTDFEYGHLSP
jgi:hypothetical protein